MAVPLRSDRLRLQISKSVYSSSNCPSRCRAIRTRTASYVGTKYISCWISLDQG